MIIEREENIATYRLVFVLLLNRSLEVSSLFVTFVTVEDINSIFLNRHFTILTLDASNPKEFFQKIQKLRTIATFQKWDAPKDSSHIFYEHWSINFSQLTRFLKKKKNQELPSEFFAKKNVYLSVLFHLSYQVSTLFNRKYVQVARNDVFFKVLDR